MKEIGVRRAVTSARATESYDFVSANADNTTPGTDRLRRAFGVTRVWSPPPNTRAPTLARSGPATVPRFAMYCERYSDVSSEENVNVDSAAFLGFANENVRCPW